MKCFLSAGITIALLSGCAASVDPSTYSVGAVGQVNRTVAATIISARDVTIDRNTGAGGAVGAGAGAVAGSAIGGGARANILGAIGGAIIGGIAGAAIEQSGSTTAGIEYVIQTSNGHLMTLVQGPMPRFSVGEPVLVLHGTPSRIISDPRK